MALKKEKKEKKEKVPREKKPLVFDPSDGVTWHDFVGILIIILKFIYRVARLVFAPIFWIYGENVRMIRFVRAKGEERTMNSGEREFVESIPVIFALTGLVGGILLGILIILEFQEVIKAFFDSLSLDFFRAIFDVLAAIIVFFYDAIVWIITGIISFLQFIWDAFISAFALNPFVALLMLVAVGVIIIIIWIVFTETGAFKTLSEKVGRFIDWLVESPNKLRFNIQNYYRRFNHFIVVKLLGQERLATRTLNYYKKTVFYTVLLAFWSYIAGIFVSYRGPTSDSTFWDNYPPEAEQIVFAATVLLLAGIVSGMIFFVFWARFLDALNRKRYISPEFITKDGEFDDDKIKDETSKVADDKPWLQEYVPKEKSVTDDSDEEKPWKKPKKTVKKEKKEKKVEEEKPEPKE